MSCRRFELSEGSSNEFWEVTVSGAALRVRFGRIGTEGVDCGDGRTRGAVVRYSTRNDLAPPVARSLTEFFTRGLAEGCFASPDRARYLAAVKPLLGRRSPAS